MGARGVNLNYTLDINKPQASTTAFTTSRKPFPLWANAYETRTDGAWHYDSAVVSVHRQAGPVAFHSSFTWSHNKTNYADTVDPYHVTDGWTRYAANRERYFTTGATVPLPFGKGHRFLAESGPVLNFLVRDWQTQAIATFASGQYYSPLFTGADPANATQGFVTQLPDCVGDPNAGARSLRNGSIPRLSPYPPLLPGATVLAV